MTMKKLAAFALLLPLSMINAAAFASDEDQTTDEKDGQWVTGFDWTLAQNDQQTEEPSETDKPESPEFTLSENDSNDVEEDSETEEDERG